MQLSRLLILQCLILVCSFIFVSTQGLAASKIEIDIGVEDALTRFKKEVGGATAFLKNAKGILVFPKVFKAGFGVGGEYGEGALLIKTKTIDYYSTAAASIGLQWGAQQKSIVIVFLDSKQLKNFQNSDGWEVGVDGSVALVEVGAGASINSKSIKDPVVAFVFGNKGLMYNLTIEGSKFSKLKK